MLTESKRHNKENSKFGDLFTKEPDTLINNTVRTLKDQISTLQLDKVNLERKYMNDIELLQLEIGQYKKKLAVLTDKYLLETFTKDHQPIQNTKDYDQIIRQQEIVLQQQRQNKKKVENRLKEVIDETVNLKKQLQQMKLEKQKSMEISLIEKINLEEKNKLLEEQVNSKKKIIANLKNELQKVYSNQESLNKQQRSISQKSKQLEYYSQQLNEYNRLNDLRLKQQLSQLAKENQFLKEYVKKIEKMAKKQCQCEVKDEKVRQNMFQIKRELALAKVKLGQNYFQEVNKDRKMNRAEDSDENESNYSFERRRM